MRESVVSQKEVGSDVESKLEKEAGHLGVRSGRSEMYRGLRREEEMGIEAFEELADRRKNLVG